MELKRRARQERDAWKLRRTKKQLWVRHNTSGLEWALNDSWCSLSQQKQRQRQRWTEKKHKRHAQSMAYECTNKHLDIIHIFRQRWRRRWLRPRYMWCTFVSNWLMFFILDSNAYALYSSRTHKRGRARGLYGSRDIIGHRVGETSKSCWWLPLI